MIKEIKHIQLIIILFTLSVLVVSCAGAKYMAKKGAEFEEAGMHEEAANYYMTSIRKNPDRVDAKKGLKRAGQISLDNKLSQFYKAFAQEENEKAVQSFLQAKDYNERVSKHGITLDFPDHYESYFEEAKKEFLIKHYEKGNQHLESKEYEEAERTFVKILNIDPKYKDVDELKKIARLEPIYEQGEEAMDRGHYREAYKHFDRVVAYDPDYKYARHLRENAKAESIFTVGVISYHDNYGIHKTAENKINAKILSELVNSNNPFIQVVDRDNIERIIDEQKLGLSGVVSEETAADAGKLMGVKAVLLGKVIEYSEEESPLRKYRETAYERYFVKVKDPDSGTISSITKYRKQYYYRYTKEHKLKVSYQYQLLSSETGQVLSTDIYEVMEIDRAEFARYSGEYRNLYPHPGSSNFQYEKRKLNELFATDNNIKSMEQLMGDAEVDISKKVANKVMSYEQSRL